MQTALGARNRNELARLFTDLPARRPRLPERLRAAWRGLRGQEGAAAPARIAAVPPQPQPGQFWEPTHLRRVPAVPEPLFFPGGSGTRFTIGRTYDCDLRLTDLSVSRMHAELTRAEDGWLLGDLGSHNGTRLNGWLVREPVPVRAGDRVEFGSAAFILQDGSPADLP
jgi:pSer/pThr/pTyr-binding forkhead associated (FHA) protein